jgi:nitronate monooxygenase
MRPAAFRTRVTDFFGIRHPIVCGGLMWLADANYVAAVANAGCMGFITAWSFPDPDEFRRQVRRCKELTGGKPFGVNISVSRRPGVMEALKPHVAITVEEGVRFVETSGSSPAPILPQLKAAGIKVMHKVPAYRYAQTAVREGADAVAIVGAECGGHPGYQMIGTIVQAAHAAKFDVPVVIGGGVGTGRQLAGLLAAGADGVILGSRMVVAEEIWAHPDYKKRVVDGDGTDSVVVMSSFKLNHRVLDNAAARKVLEMEAAGLKEVAPYQPLIAGTEVRKAYETGDWSTGMIDYGQAMAFADAVEPAEAIIDGLVDDAVAAASRLEAMRVEHETGR